MRESLALAGEEFTQKQPGGRGGRARIYAAASAGRRPRGSEWNPADGARGGPARDSGEAPRGAFALRGAACARAGSSWLRPHSRAEEGRSRARPAPSRPRSATPGRRLPSGREEEVGGSEEPLKGPSRTAPELPPAAWEGNWSGSHDIWFQPVCGFHVRMRVEFKIFNSLPTSLTLRLLGDLVNS